MTFQFAFEILIQTLIENENINLIHENYSLPLLLFFLSNFCSFISSVVLQHLQHTYFTNFLELALILYQQHLLQIHLLHRIL